MPLCNAHILQCPAANVARRLMTPCCGLRGHVGLAYLWSSVSSHPSVPHAFQCWCAVSPMSQACSHLGHLLSLLYCESSLHTTSGQRQEPLTILSRQVPTPQSLLPLLHPPLPKVIYLLLLSSFHQNIHVRGQGILLYCLLPQR